MARDSSSGTAATTGSTGILLRTTEIGSQGHQVLLDDRQSGNIGGIFGNGIGAFHAIGFTIDAAYDESGRPIGLKGDDPATSVEPFSQAKPRSVDRGGR
jgi:hypothetical protein